MENRDPQFAAIMARCYSDDTVIGVGRGRLRLSTRVVTTLRSDLARAARVDVLVPRKFEVIAPDGTVIVGLVSLTTVTRPRR